MGLKEIEWEGVVCIHIAQDRVLVNMIMDFWVL